MSENLNINGRTVDPNSIRQIQVPEGKKAVDYVKENENLIKKNFKDELFFEADGKLFVTEDKFVIEDLGLKKPSDAKIKFGAVPAVAILIDDEPDAHKVTALDFKGAKSHLEWLKKELDIENGDKVTLHNLQKEADRLFKSDKFLSVNFTPEPTEKGIKLTLDVVEIPNEIKFQGVPQAQQAALKALFPTPLTKENIQKGLAAVEKQYENDPKSLLASLDFTVSGAELQVMVSQATVPQNMVFSGLNVNEVKEVEKFFQKPLNYDNIQKGMEQTRQHFNKQGIILPRFEFGVNGDELNIVLVKSPMPLSLTLQGATVYPEADIKALFKEPLTMENIQDGLKKLKEKYEKDGYLLQPPEGVSADLEKGQLTIAVKELRLSDIELSGNDKTKDKVITRELRGQKDKPVNIKTLDEDLKRVYGTGLFGNISKTVEPDPENPDKVKIKLHLNEEKTSSFTAGLGYSMGNGVFGNAGLTLGNLGGTNQKLSLDLTAGQKIWGGGLSYYNPWMFGERVSFGSSIYHREWESPYGHQRNTGAKVTIGKPLGDIYESKWRSDLSLTAERIQVADGSPINGSAPTINPNGVDLLVGLKPSITYDSRDNRALPHEGTRWHLALEPMLVNGTSFVGKAESEFEHHIPLGERFTLSGGLQGGTMVGADKPLYLQFNNIGPERRLYGFDPMFGSNYALANVKGRVDIWGPVSATLGVTAGDFWNGTDFKPKIGAGAGINVKIGSMGVLHAGYGHQLYGGDIKEGNFIIGFGTSF